jgi:hypothetical protein
MKGSVVSEHQPAIAEERAGKITKEELAVNKKNIGDLGQAVGTAVKEALADVEDVNKKGIDPKKLDDLEVALKKLSEELGKTVAPANNPNLNFGHKDSMEEAAEKGTQKKMLSALNRIIKTLEQKTK